MKEEIGTILTIIGGFMAVILKDLSVFADQIEVAVLLCTWVLVIIKIAYWGLQVYSWFKTRKTKDK